MWKYLAATIRPGDIGLNATTDANSALSNILSTVYYIAGIVCVIVIIVAGILYITSQGEASKVKQAKNAILAAAIGLVVTLMAFVITGFILDRF